MHTVEVPVRGAGTGPTASAASILSAHFTVDDGPQLGGADALTLVFSVELDASTVIADHFIVLRDDGRRVRPAHALLSPANESDENRTVLLLGNFGGPKDHPATNVAVTGPLYAESGEPLRGLATTVLPYGEPPAVVYVELLAPAPGRCEQSKSVVRTYWTAALRALAAESVARVRLQTRGGETVHPSRFDDQGAPGEDDADDNVLDLCVEGDGVITVVQIEAGVVTDPAGHANAAVEVSVPGATQAGSSAQ